MARSLSMRVLVLACIVVLCAAEDYPVAWKIALDKSTLAVKCGDTISFKWSGNTHDIVKNTKDGCTSSDGKMLLGTTSTGDYKYTVTKDDTKLYFICTVGQHCINGQKLTVTSTCANTSSGNTTSTSKNGAAGHGTAITFAGAVALAITGMMLLV